MGNLMTIIEDMHVHSDNSPDAVDPVMLLCEKAVSKGIQYLAITDHCEINEFYESGYHLALKQSYFDIIKAKSVFSRELCLINGIELGQATQGKQIAEKITHQGHYDFILASLHNIKGRPDFAFLDYTAEDPEVLFGAYLDELYELVEWGDFDVLAHLTYPLRYIEGKYKITIDLNQYMGQFNKILQKLALKGKGLEINTSGLRQEYGKFMPEKKILRIFKNVGGEIITIGSDSHQATDIGSHFSDAVQAVKEAGFSKIAYYMERKPYFVDI